jgi:hypothetical protein
MSFGKNPHVAKAEAAELKARSARDDAAYEQAWRDAARQWDRAADRESDDKRRQLYAEKADAARSQADEPRVQADDDSLELEAPETIKPSLLN